MKRAYHYLGLVKDLETVIETAEASLLYDPKTYSYYIDYSDGTDEVELMQPLMGIKYVDDAFWTARQIWIEVMINA